MESIRVSVKNESRSRSRIYILPELSALRFPIQSLLSITYTPNIRTRFLAFGAFYKTFVFNRTSQS